MILYFLNAIWLNHESLLNESYLKITDKFPTAKNRINMSDKTNTKIRNSKNVKQLKNALIRHLCIINRSINHFWILFKVYTIAEDYYKGKPNRIGATGLEILYYYVPEGTVYLDSESTQKRLINEILNEQDDYELLGEVLSQ